MRIAVLCTDLGVRVPGSKGASVHLMAITDAFAALGHDVMLVAVGGHGPAPAGIDHLLYPHPGRSQGIRRELRKLRFVEHVGHHARGPLTDFGPDVVYERLSLFGTAGIGLAAAVGARHVVEVNALLAREEAAWRGLRLARLAAGRDRRVLGAADLRVAVSDEVAGQIEETAPGRPTAVVANGVDLRLFEQTPARAGARHQLGLPADAPVAAFVGALRPWHGVDVALRAMALTPSDLRLVVAGDGPVRRDLQQLAVELGVASRVHWLGQVPHDRTATVLAAADVALAPYPALDHFSFSPLKVYEYLAAGVPVIASDIGQITTALDSGGFGTLVPAGDPNALAAALRQVVGDPAGAQARAGAGQLHAHRHHGWPMRARAILEQLDQSAGHRRQEARSALAR